MSEKNKSGFHFEHSYLKLPHLFYTEGSPTPGPNPEPVIFNELLAGELGLNSAYFKSDEGIAILSGSVVPKSALPIAQAYAGHQFGSFTRLGDGRAILLGEHLIEDKIRYDIQLKGAGQTAYSRGGDGRAGLSAMLREYIISEGMHGLGVPTTRSLAVAKTGAPVIREEVLEGAVLTRVASSHIRVGTFQYATAFGSREDLQSLADYTVKRHDADLLHVENPYLGLLRRVIKRQAELIAGWQCVGFIHGVMNTDNMTISGETIDYGPCAFMDIYNPATVFSSIDHEARYAYGNQPYIGGWNLTRFAESLLSLIHEDELQAIKLAQDALLDYNVVYDSSWLERMRAKLGIFNTEETDKELIDNLLDIMTSNQVDYTNTFIDLTLQTHDNNNFYQTEEFKAWHIEWKERISRQPESIDDVKQLMKQSNPAVIPRNYFVEEALESAVEDDNNKPLKDLLKALEHPYAYNLDQEKYRNAPVSIQRYQTYCGT